MCFFLIRLCRVLIILRHVVLCNFIRVRVHFIFIRLLHSLLLRLLSITHSVLIIICNVRPSLLLVLLFILLNIYTSSSYSCSSSSPPMVMHLPTIMFRRLRLLSPLYPSASSSPSSASSYSSFSSSSSSSSSYASSSYCASSSYSYSSP